MNSVENSFIIKDVLSNRIETIESWLKQTDSLKTDTADLVNILKNRINKIEEEQQKILLLASVQRMDLQLQKSFVESVSKKVESKLSISIKSSVDDVANRLNSLETLIISDPNKALSMPFLKRDISDIKRKVAEIDNKTVRIDQVMLENAGLKVQTQSLKDQLSQLNNWIIGIFGALGVSVIGLVINNIVQQRKQNLRS